MCFQDPPRNAEGARLRVRWQFGMGVDGGRQENWCESLRPPASSQEFLSASAWS